MKTVSRSEAKAFGMKQYFTGIPCSRGHVEWRTTSDGQCHGCGREKMRSARGKKKLKAMDAREKLISEYAIQFAGSERAEGRAIPRFAAIQIGLKTYFTGEPCSRGHLADRFLTSGICCLCSIENGVARYAINRESDREKHREWRKKNPGYRRAYRASNRDMYRVIDARQSARRRFIKSEGSTASEVRAWLKQQKKCCYWCGSNCRKRYHIDHYEPLARGGKHVVENLVISCPQCNLRKHAKDPYEFAASMGRLF